MLKKEALYSAASEHIAAYKLPRAFLFVEKVLRSPSGKVDYRWAKATAAEKLDQPAIRSWNERIAGGALRCSASVRGLPPHP